MELQRDRQGAEGTVRPAVARDLATLNEIYNHYVRTSAVTFDVEETSMAARRLWFERFAGSGRHRLLVVEQAGRVQGYACSHRFREKAAYDTTVETSVYCAADAVSRGLGRALYRTLLDALEGEDVHRVYAGITLPNPASLALHRSFGFRPLARLREVGRKFGRYWDVQWMERPGPTARAADGRNAGSEESSVRVMAIEDAIDLHGFAPRDVLRAVEAYLEAAVEAGFEEVRLIHGKGKGVQRARVQELLGRSPRVLRFADAPPARGAWGATLVRLRRG